MIIYPILLHEILCNFSEMQKVKRNQIKTEYLWIMIAFKEVKVSGGMLEFFGSGTLPNCKLR